MKEKMQTFAVIVYHYYLTECLPRFISTVDWVALSFVQRPEDIEEIRELIDAKIFVTISTELND